MNKLVYLLEDDESITDVVTCALMVTNIGIKTFDTIEAFKEGFKNKKPDLCLLDIMLPDGNGLDVLKYIKHFNPEIKCIMLSALGSEVDKVKGLNMGADDYVSKPFGTMELIARINSHLRNINKNELNINNIQVNLDKHEVLIDDKLTILNKKEFELLIYLMQNHDIVISRDRLLEAVWGYDVGETRTVDNHVLRLRKLGIDSIETVFGVGYKFVTRD